MPSLKTPKGVPIFLALLLVSATAQAERVQERFAKTFPLKPGARFELLSANGAMTLEAWDRDEVHVVAEKWAESKRSDVAKKALARLRIETSQTPEGLTVRTRFPDPGLMDWLQGKEAETGVTYRIRVPRQATIIAESSRGDITLTGIRGKAFLENTHGAILVNAVQGRMSLITVNGDIKVRAPAGSRMTLDVTAVHGGIQSDFQVAGSDPKNANVLQGTVNGGGEKVFIRSVNGAIQLSRF